MYQSYGFGLMMAKWAETCRRVFNFLILITNICCVIDEINSLYYRKTQQDSSHHKLKGSVWRGTSIYQNELPYMSRSIFGSCKAFLRTGVWHFKTLPLSKVIWTGGWKWSLYSWQIGLLRIEKTPIIHAMLRGTLNGARCIRGSW